MALEAEKTERFREVTTQRLELTKIVVKRKALEEENAALANRSALLGLKVRKLEETSQEKDRHMEILDDVRSKLITENQELRQKMEFYKNKLERKEEDIRKICGISIFKNFNSGLQQNGKYNEEFRAILINDRG